MARYLEFRIRVPAWVGEFQPLALSLKDEDGEQDQEEDALSW